DRDDGPGKSIRLGTEPAALAWPRKTVLTLVNLVVQPRNLAEHQERQERPQPILGVPAESSASAFTDRKCTKLAQPERPSQVAGMPFAIPIRFQNELGSGKRKPDPHPTR